jgi:hypothetical protein
VKTSVAFFHDFIFYENLIKRRLCLKQHQIQLFLSSNSLRKVLGKVDTFGIYQVDTAGPGNGAVEKMGAAERKLKSLGRHYFFNALPLRRHPPAHACGRRAHH